MFVLPPICRLGAALVPQKKERRKRVKISSRVLSVTCSINFGVLKGVYPNALANAVDTAMFAPSLSPTNVTLTPFISSPTASHAALSAFVASADGEASAAARVTGVERLFAEDTRKRREETTAEEDEQHPTAETRDIPGEGRRRAKV